MSHDILSNQQMKRQRAFLDAPAGPTKRAKTVSIVPLQPKLNKTQEVQVRRLIARREETKSFVKGAVGVSNSNVATIVSLSDIPLGQTDNARIGNHVHIKSVIGHLNFIAGDATNTMRCIIFKWKENDTFNTPTAAQILANGPTGAADVFSTYNRDSPGNYVILEDWFMVGSTGTSSPFLIQKKQINKRVGGKMMFYSDVGTTGTNKIYLLALSDSSAVTHPSFNYNIEIGYSDD